MEECLIEITQNGDELRLKLTAPSFGVTVERSQLQLDSNDLDKMRRGDPPIRLINDLKALLSSWFHEPNLTLLPALLGFSKADTPSLRLIFNIDIDDDKLRYDIANIPFELLTVPESGNQSYVLHHRITSIVHLLPKTSQPATTANYDWPLKILIVRSSPNSLPEVPEAKPIRDFILALRPDLSSENQDLINIDILSREGPDFSSPTIANLRNQLRITYDILIYLGHGDVREGQAGAPPIGQLQLERPNDAFPDALDADQLSPLLLSVPVVLLVGCLTAAELTPDNQEAFLEVTPDWIQGSQGVAQTLISGATGVQFVVGMRYRIEVRDAVTFLESFFKELLRSPPDDPLLEDVAGNLEYAIQQSRISLKLTSSLLLSYASPVIFRTLGSEPTFPFLASVPAFPVPESFQKLRNTLWSFMVQVNWDYRQPGMANERLYVDMKESLFETEQEMLNEILAANAVLLWPKILEVNPGFLGTDETEIFVPVQLNGQLVVSELEGMIAEGSGRVRLIGLEPTPILTANNFDFFPSSNQNGFKFLIRHQSNTQQLVPQGELFNVKLAINQDVAQVYKLQITNINSTPIRSITPGSNAVIVPPP